VSHFARLDENNIVTQVAVGDNNDPNGDEGYKFFNEVIGGRWVQTSYNATIRGKFAGIGDYYDEALDLFTSEKEK
jgi:hypothetical protein